MSAIVVVGAQWGDEGKGKIVDLLAEKADAVVRYSGGDNAGHTVINDRGEFKLHLIPSGIFYAHADCIIGNGVVVNPVVFISEMEDLVKRGIDVSRLYISDRAHLIMPYHILFDKLEEEALGKKAVGTTLKGIGPAFADKIARTGIRVGELLDKENFLIRLRQVLERKNAILTKVYGAKPLSLEEVYEKYCQFADRLAPYIRETTSMLDEALKKGQKVLLEGAQGTLLDPDFGTYPFNTSSSPTSAGACLGSGISPTGIKSILAVFKAYCTRVGGGPFPTELKDETGEKIRRCAHEYGTTTGRARRCGWFDAVGARFSRRINGFTGTALTRLDVLGILPTIKICVGYMLEGKQIAEFPSNVMALEKCQPVYEEMPGWMTSINDIRTYKQLPLAARRYINRLEELCDCPIDIVSVGPKREQTIIRKPVF